MQLAVFSDMHGNYAALEAALADYRAVCPDGAEVVWMLGDVAAMGPRPAECVRAFMTMAQTAKAAREAADAQAGAQTGEDAGVQAQPAEGVRPPFAFRGVRGNTDRYLVTGTRHAGKAVEKAEEFADTMADRRQTHAALDWASEQLSFEEYRFLAELRGECELHIPGYGVVIGYHGTPGDDEGRLTPEMEDAEAADALLDREGRLAIGGHIHVQMDRVLPYGWRAINVGSVGVSYDMPGRAQWGLFTFDEGEVTVDLRAVPYDVEAVIADLRAVGFPSVEMMERRLREGVK